MTARTGTVPRRVRIGASLPLTEIVHRFLGLHKIMFSFAFSYENFHAPNEYFSLDSIPDGLAAWVRILREIAYSDVADYAPYRQR